MRIAVAVLVVASVFETGELLGVDFVGSGVARAQTVEPGASERARTATESRETGSRESGPRDEVSAVPRAPEEERPPAPPPDLFPEDALGSAVGWELAPEPAPSDPEAVTQDRIDRWADDEIRRDRVSAGIVDGWYYSLRHQMRASFRPDVHAVLSDLTRGMSPLDRVTTELGRHAAPRQTPMDPRGVSPQTLFSRSREDEYVQDTFDQANPLYAPITWHRVELRVVHTRAGEIARVEVTVSSGSESLDAAAVEAVRTGSAAVPEPPGAVTGERDAFVSEWAFEMGDVASRVNGVSGMEGPTGEGMQAGVLGRGIMRTSVSLIRVTDAANPSVEERRAPRRERRARERDR